MLILTRKIGEAIRIGDDIQIFILNVNHLQVKIGIQAPKNIRVLREELCKGIAENTREKLKKIAI